MLFLHGAGLDSQLWRRQLDRFDEFDLHFLDLRGHGRSPMHVGRRVTLADVVDDIDAVLTHVGAERVTLVGHSWGGAPAQLFSVRQAARTSGLVMIGAPGVIRERPTTERVRMQVMTPLLRLLPWSAVSRWSARYCSEVSSTREYVASSLALTGRQTFIDLGLEADASVTDVAGHGDLGATPTLLLSGEDDMPALLAPIYEDLVAANPHASIKTIAATRHCPMLDTPDDFDDALARFFDRTDLGSAPGG
ncbi:MAG: alpha/beta hydrolase [Actinomycetota bacterium]